MRLKHTLTAASTRALVALHRLSLSPWLWTFMFVAFFAGDLHARVGGGQSYSGGSRGGGGGFSGGGGGGGGGGGEADLIFFLIWLCIEHPFIGIPVVLIILAVVAFNHFKNPNKGDGWQSAGTPTWTPPSPTPGNNPKARKVDLEPLRRFDPNFSQLLLEDFLASLYTRSHEARGAGTLNLLSPYLSENARRQLGERGTRKPTKVSGVVVGSQILTQFSGIEAPTVKITVEFEANYTDSLKSGKDQSFYVKERWILTRRRDAVSRKPDALLSFHCPNCGAPVEESQDEACANCDAVFNSGEFDWFVEGVTLLTEKRRGPQLTGDTPEHGSNLPTLVAPGLETAVKAIQARDAEFHLTDMTPRVKLIFNEIQTAWTELRWDDARPFTTDRFHIAQSYWIRAYQEQGLRNVLNGMTITRVQPVKVTSDPFFDGVTWRIWAQGEDYTIRVSDNQVVSGRKNRRRAFSEYWTFIRSVDASGPAKADKNCPNCGAPLKINQAGHCEYCQAKIVGGGFDWVLSRIEQDESYRG